MIAEFTVTGVEQPFTTLICRLSAGQAGLAEPKSTYPGLVVRQVLPTDAVSGRVIGGWPDPFTVAVPV
jgi:hypothetical protein